MEEHRVDIRGGKLIDADIAESGRTAAIIQADDVVTLSVDEIGQPLPVEVQFPLVRFIGEQGLLVAGTRTQKGQKNAAALDLDSGHTSTFYIGDAIQEIVAFGGRFATAYFDEAFGNNEGLYGLVLFDTSGTPIWRDNGFVDCYCACARSNTHLLYLCYPGFVLKQLDVETLQTQEWTIPAVLHGAKAITSLGDTIFFHSPHDDTTGIYSWKPGAPHPQRVGDYPPRLRGLRGGRFVSVDEAGITVLDLKD